MNMLLNKIDAKIFQTAQTSMLMIQEQISAQWYIPIAISFLLIFALTRCNFLNHVPKVITFGTRNLQTF